MGRVLSNNLALSVVEESALGTAKATGWLQLEPNSLTAWGATLTTTPRSPISKNRQRRKGRPTDLNSAVSYEADLTLASFRRFLKGFVFAEVLQEDVTDLSVTAVATSDDSYTVAALDAAQVAKLPSEALLWARGFSNSANNGLKSVETAPSATDTTIEVFENLTDESSPPGNARVSLAGYRDTASWDWNAARTSARHCPPPASGPRSPRWA